MQIVGAEYFRSLLIAMAEAGYTHFYVQEGIFPEIVVFDDIRDKDGWPAVWDAVKKARLDWGCGATLFHQFNPRKMRGFGGEYWIEKIEKPQEE